MAENIDSLLQFDEVDGAMIGPLDLAGSLGVPGQPNHPLVLECSQRVIEASRRHGVACGLKLLKLLLWQRRFSFQQGYTFAILGSDLFVLTSWASKMKSLIHEFSI